MFLFVGQNIFPRVRFSSSVTGTPTAQFFVNGVSSGSAVNGTGSGSVWYFNLTVPSVAVGSYVEVEVTGTVSGVSQYKICLQGSVAELVESSSGGGLDAAGIRAAIGLSSANLDTQLSGIPAGVWASGTRTITGGTVTTVSDKTGYSLSQSFPANFAALGINASGHISRVTLVDTTTTNTDMRGTNNALLASSYVAPPSAATNASAVRTELSTELGRIDAAITTRLASASYTAPSNSDIAAIKAKTDNLTFTVSGFLDCNLYRWRGTQPGTLDANNFVPANTAAINGNTTRVATLSTALDNDYLSKLNVSGVLAHTDNANTFKADVSGALTTYKAAKKSDVINASQY